MRVLKICAILSTKIGGNVCINKAHFSDTFTFQANSKRFTKFTDYTNSHSVQINISQQYKKHTILKPFNRLGRDITKLVITSVYHLECTHTTKQITLHKLYSDVVCSNPPICIPSIRLQSLPFIITVDYMACQHVASKLVNKSMLLICLWC